MSTNERPASCVWQPWNKKACCEDATVATKDVIKDAYGDHWHWDRCGPMSEVFHYFLYFLAFD